MTTAFTKRTGIILALVASVIAVLVGGWFVFSRVLNHAEPRKVLAVTTRASAESANELERTVSEPLERALMRVPGVTSLRTETRYGWSLIVVSFEGDEFVFQQAARAALSAVQPQLPEDASHPELSLLAEQPVEERYLIRSDVMDALTLSSLVKEKVVREFEMQSGVRRVEVCGGVEQTRLVTLDPRKLRAHGVGLLDAVERAERSDESVLDFARVELSSVPDECRAWLDGAPVLVVTVTRFVPGETKLPMLPPGVSLKRVEKKIEGEYRADQPPRSGLVLQRGRELISFDPLIDVPVLRKPGGVVVRVVGEDRAALRSLATSLRAAVKSAAWVGEVSPGDDQPQRRVEIDRRGPDVGRLLVLALDGSHHLPGTTVKIEGGIDDVTLDDGRPLRAFVTVHEELAPELVLRVDRRPAMEFAVGATENEVRRAIAGVALPTGVSVVVTSY